MSINNEPSRIKILITAFPPFGIRNTWPLTSIPGVYGNRSLEIWNMLQQEQERDRTLSGIIPRVVRLEFEGLNLTDSFKKVFAKNLNDNPPSGILMMGENQTFRGLLPGIKIELIIDDFKERFSDRWNWCRKFQLKADKWASINNRRRVRFIHIGFKVPFDVELGQVKEFLKLMIDDLIPPDKKLTAKR